MYEFELEEKANKTKTKLFILLYVILLIATIVMGAAVKLQQIKSYELKHTSSKKICKACISGNLTVPVKNGPKSTPTISINKTLEGLDVQLKTTPCIGPVDKLDITLNITNTLREDLPLEKAMFIIPAGFEYVADSAKVNGTSVPISNLEIEQYSQALNISIKILADYLPLKVGNKLLVSLSVQSSGTKEGTYKIETNITATNYEPLEGIVTTFKVNSTCAQNTPTTTATLPPTMSPTHTTMPTNPPTTTVTPPETGIIEVVSVIITLSGIVLIALGVDLYLAGYKIKVLAPVYNALTRLDYKIRTQIFKLKDPISYFELKLRNRIKRSRKRKKATRIKNRKK